MFTNLATNIKPKKAPNEDLFTSVYNVSSILHSIFSKFYPYQLSRFGSSEIDMLSRVRGRESSERKGKTSDHNKVHTSERRNQRKDQYKDKQLPRMQF